MTPASVTPAIGQRIVAVDVFRGLTIAGMILVNNPGSWARIYPPLRHARWHGWTPTDLVFPFFLFIVGVAIVLGLSRRVAGGAPRGALIAKITRRAAILFATGVFMAGFPFVDWESFAEGISKIRIPGVLQRIALCYLIVSAMFLFLPRRSLGWICAGCLLVYWGLMTLVPVPGHDGAYGVDHRDANLAAWLDRLLLDGHLWRQRAWDPEGVLSTIPAVATTLFGVFAGKLLLVDRPTTDKVGDLLINGALLVVAGYVWSWFFPINKSLWTSSYAVFTAGQAMCGLALCLWLVDVKGWRRPAQPFVVYGVNALTVFVMSGLIAKCLSRVKIDGFSVKTHIYDNVFASWLADYPASLAYALAWVSGWYLVLWLMYRRGWILRV